MGVTRLKWGLLALLPNALCGALPYDSTRIFLVPNTSYAYIFQPTGDTQATLSLLDLSKTLDTSTALDLSVVSESLPFLSDRVALSYTPTIDIHGNISVVSGNCSQGANGVQIWRSQLQDGDFHANRTWSQDGLSTQELGGQQSQAGVGFLADGISFAQSPKSTVAVPELYIFGGLCPFANSTDQTWTSSASYSNTMWTVTPQGGSSSSPNYNIGIVTGQGPPIAQAGASLTPLTPTFSVGSDGAANTQQQTFVLLGGQTDVAFINMSQLALFSLPQQTWSFVPVQQPSNTRTDLTLRKRSTEVTPRSGHSAVLSEDGQSIIVFGGWVGDVQTPADPQLAILHLGADYGGNGQWAWTIPEQSGNGPPSGSGLYGHGAAVLPGGVMMIYGGYEIPTSTAKMFRRASSEPSQKTYLLNTTSGAWINSFTPNSPSSSGQVIGKSGALSSTSQKVGLGTGLGIGSALVFTVAAFYVWHSRRPKGANESGDDSIYVHPGYGSTINPNDQELLDANAVHWSANEALHPDAIPADGVSGNYQRPPEMQHTTGMYVNTPSPTRGLRRGFVNRYYQYQPAPIFDENGLSRASGNIHTITEHDEEEAEEARIDDDDGEDGLTDAERKLREVERVLHADGPLDPFRDPAPSPLRSHPVSPGETVEMTQSGHQGLNWFAIPERKQAVRSQDEARNSHLLSGTIFADGRTSPTRTDDRTSSTLSERSTLSNNSITRTMSTRTGAVLAAAMAASSAQPSSQAGSASPTDERSYTMSSTGGRKSPFAFTSRPRSAANGSYYPPSVGDGDSFVSAHSNFVQLQSEGEALLGGRPVSDPDDPYQRALAAQGRGSSDSANMQLRSSDPYSYRPSNSSAIVAAARRRQVWMGSLKRALNVVAGGVTSNGERSFSLTGARDSFVDQAAPTSALSSPSKDRSNPLLDGKPRRAVSDGGAFLRQKRGQKDWYRDEPGQREEEEEWGQQPAVGPQVPRHGEDGRRRSSEEEGEWDVEGAASKRDVQVMFTVPKARLRVVNDDMDRASLRSASEGAVSRNGSVKNLSLWREESLNAGHHSHGGGGGGGRLLPSTEEEKFVENDSEKEKKA